MQLIVRRKTSAYLGGQPNGPCSHVSVMSGVAVPSLVFFFFCSVATAAFENPLVDATRLEYESTTDGDEDSSLLLRRKAVVVLTFLWSPKSSPSPRIDALASSLAPLSVSLSAA